MPVWRGAKGPGGICEWLLRHATREEHDTADGFSRRIVLCDSAYSYKMLIQGSDMVNFQKLSNLPDGLLISFNSVRQLCIHPTIGPATYEINQPSTVSILNDNVASLPITPDCSSGLQGVHCLTRFNRHNDSLTTGGQLLEIECRWVNGGV